MEDSQRASKSKNVYLVAIKKNNMKDKNRDLDRWITVIQRPYERVFSEQNRRMHYIVIAKNQFAEFMNAICLNLCRLTVIKPHFLALINRIITPKFQNIAEF